MAKESWRRQIVKMKKKNKKKEEEEEKAEKSESFIWLKIRFTR